LIFESAESLIAKTLEHFQHEEKILESLEYQGLPEHRAAHEVISKEFTRDEERTRATANSGSTGPYEVLPRLVAQAFAK
jgi:hemerythrin